MSVNDNAWTGFVNGFFEIFAQCPVYLEVTDPSNNVTNLGQNDIEGAEYRVYDFDDNGSLDHKIFIPSPDTGTYHIKVIPFDSAPSNDSFSLSIRDEYIVEVLVKDEYILNIPADPYTHTIKEVTSVESKRIYDSELISIYPNPFTDVTIINLENQSAQRFSIIVRDVAGRIVRQIDNLSGPTYELNRNGLENGVYFVEILSDRTYLKKIVIQ